MQDCLRSEYAPCEVYHVGKTGDGGGIDLKLVLSDKETFLIQVKRRSDLSKREGVNVVRELNGVLFREGVSKGMVISTARGYTKAAERELNVKTDTSETYLVRLLDYYDIVKMLNLPMVNPYRPWRDYIDVSKLSEYTIESEIF